MYEIHRELGGGTEKLRGKKRICGYVQQCGDCGGGGRWAEVVKSRERCWKKIKFKNKIRDVDSNQELTWRLLVTLHVVIFGGDLSCTQNNPV